MYNYILQFYRKTSTFVLCWSTKRNKTKEIQMRQERTSEAGSQSEGCTEFMVTEVVQQRRGRKLTTPVVTEWVLSIGES